MGIFRFVLAIIVVFAHIPWIIKIPSIPSSLAVQVFFVISGFYMTLILNTKYIGKSSYKLFISNRFLRIYPIYWAVFLFIIIYSLLYLFISRANWTGPFFDPYAHYIGDMDLLTFIFLFFSNIFIFFQDLVMFLGLNLESGKLFFTSNFKNTEPALFNFLFIPQAWSIAIELMFYLIAPFILRRKFLLVLSLIGISFLIRFVLFRFELKEDPWSYRFFPSELSTFLLGYISYKIYIRIKEKSINKKIPAFILFTLILISIIFQTINIAYLNMLYISIATISIPFIFHLTKNSKIDRQIGELSYPIYISHMFVIQSFPNIPINFETPITKAIYIVCTTIILSYILNRFIAIPVERIRKNRFKRESKI